MPWLAEQAGHGIEFDREALDRLRAYPSCVQRPMGELKRQQHKGVKITLFICKDCATARLGCIPRSGVELSRAPL
jgi:hypothetical protein